MNATGLFYWQYAALFALCCLVLILPIVSHKIENNIELFLFACGGAALAISNAWSARLLAEAVEAPIAISATVLFFGLCFHFGREGLERLLAKVSGHISLRMLIFFIVVVSGFLASIITAVIAALIVVEVVKAAKFHRAYGIQVIVLSCFSIGLGAALTPVGEPLSTVVTSQLHADFFFLFRLLGIYIAPAVVLIGLAAVFMPEPSNGTSIRDWEPAGTALSAVWRAVKVYVFVVALLMLGAGFEPVATRFIAPLSGHLLFWANIISAALDNATLAAAETNSSLHSNQLSAALLGLLTSGGILIPGNIPNIVAASHLRITSREWARIGVPVGLTIMAFTFGAWYLLEG
jgi:predicted cation transporter